MKKVSREKAALVVFFLLGFSVLAIAIAYICTLGHSLNVAASSIDDAAGSLDGYTALVYEGTAENHRETVVDTTGVKDGKLTPTKNQLRKARKKRTSSALPRHRTLPRKEKAKTRCRSFRCAAHMWKSRQA